MRNESPPNTLVGTIPAPTGQCRVRPCKGQRGRRLHSRNRRVRGEVRPVERSSDVGQILRSNANGPSYPNIRSQRAERAHDVQAQRVSFKQDFCGADKRPPTRSLPGGSFVDDAVWIKGTRLREAREGAHLRLADVAGGIMSPANLSRIERHERYRLPLSAMASLGRRLGLMLGDDLDSHVWARAAGGTAIDLLSQWRFSEALRVLRLRDAVVTSEDPVTELQAQILSEWARTRCGQPARPEALHDLSMQARERGAPRQAVWAGILEAEMHDHAGDGDRASTLFSDTIVEADRVGTAVDILCARAAWARHYLKREEFGRGLAVLHDLAGDADSIPGYGRARVLHARGLL